MSSRIYFRGSRAQARAIVFQLAAILTGKVRDSANIAKGVFNAVGFAALSDVKADFITKARGGMGEDGEKWPPLSPEYLAYQRRFGPGEKKALKAAAGVTSKMRYGTGGMLKTTVIDHQITERYAQNRGLLTAIQLKRWKLIFARTLARLMLSMGEGPAKKRAAQIAWATLKNEGAKTLLQVYGHRQVEILRDTGILFNSLSPGKLSGSTYEKPAGDGGELQIFETISNGVIVGTNVPYAAAHNYGSPKQGIPKRQFLPEKPPDIWLKRWADAASDALLSAARLAFQLGGAT